MSQSANLALPFLAAAQAQKHVTVNESLVRLDALVQLAALSQTTGAEPASPADGALYILPAGKAGTHWAAMADGALAYWRDGAWEEIAPREGWRAYVADEEQMRVFDGAAWRAIERAARFAINTTPDSTNRLAVKSDAALLSHDDVTPGTGDMRVIVNKAGAGQTASFVFQDAFSGRAEIGLAGDDNFSFKVSADGAAWTSALTIDRTNGWLGLGTAGPAGMINLSAFGGGASVLLDSYGASAGTSGGLHGRRARGTQSAPAAVQANDALMIFGGRGYGATGFAGGTRANMAFWAAENWTDTAQGAYITLRTTAIGAAATAEAVRIAPDGRVGIGVTAPACALDVEGPARVKSYTVATVPSAAAGAGQIIYVSDESGGAVLAFSDGAAWRRVTDRAAIS